MLYFLRRTCIPAARSHVNRLCLAADVPLVESGSAGYQGQVSVIRKVKGHHQNKHNLVAALQDGVVFMLIIRV